MQQEDDQGCVCLEWSRTTRHSGAGSAAHEQLGTIFDTLAGCTNGPSGAAPADSLASSAQKEAPEKVVDGVTRANESTG